HIRALTGGRRTRPILPRCHQSRWWPNRGRDPLRKRPGTVQTNRATSEAKKKLIPLMGKEQDLTAPLSRAEQDQIKEIEKNLINFFRKRGQQIITRPLINGCGYIDASEADVISGVSLFEIKAVDRSFKGTDIKQLMTYCALNHASRQFDIQDIAIFNPRQGIWFQLNLDNIAREISGQSAQELCERVALTLCSGDISR
ncbi:MAG: hypothetical protein ACK53U_00945, partial [Alphaproteobacteria bacterium]